MVTKGTLGSVMNLFGELTLPAEGLGNHLENCDSYGILGAFRDREVKSNIGRIGKSPGRKRNIMFIDRFFYRLQIFCRCSFSSQGNKPDFENLADLDENVCVLLTSSGRQVLRVEQRARSRLEQNRSHARLNADD